MAMQVGLFRTSDITRHIKRYMAMRVGLFTTSDITRHISQTLTKLELLLFPLWFELWNQVLASSKFKKHALPERKPVTTVKGNSRVVIIFATYIMTATFTMAKSLHAGTLQLPSLPFCAPTLTKWIQFFKIFLAQLWSKETTLYSL